MNISETIDNVVNWDFLNEPLWRWFVFLVALMFFGIVWRGIVEFIK